MDEPSHHVLRVLAAVPVPSRVLDLGCGDGAHTEALARLGFEVDACDARAAAVEAVRQRLASISGAEDAREAVSAASLDALDYPDATFDWIVAYRPENYASSPEAVQELLGESRRLLKPGGWVYIALPDTDGYGPDQLGAAADAVDLAEASAPECTDEHGASLVRAIFRRVDSNTPR